jgi:hypothetical protein
VVVVEALLAAFKAEAALQQPQAVEMQIHSWQVE